MTTPPPQGQAPYPPQGQNPYGQPPAGAPYPPQPGQPTAPQQPYPAFNQGAPVPAPAAPRRGKKLLLRIGGFILVAILIAVGKWYLGKSDAESIAVGSCMHNEGTMGQPEMNEVDCSSSDAEFKVVEKFDGTSDADKCEAVKASELAYFQQGKGHDVVLCLKRAK
ncbi:LppU/SCO3897 family protein [Streptomyces sp. G5(2025)]|uniref:LppU/SCO3897 family protein n=1 Tax=Streptomyces sp. G5(2025) TaxID=3406628 RepID=UPI003C1587F0